MNGKYVRVGVSLLVSDLEVQVKHRLETLQIPFVEWR